ncbi:thioredoxin family protein, partial [Escherichia coli]|uniref:thioredoxin family protein n=1 Tax=Escherichia coli TaxID=562 RepID=UPI003C78BA37
ASEAAFDRVRFVRVNFDTDLDFLRANRVSSQSTIIVVKGGREASRFVGVTRAGEIRTRITAAV